MLSVVERFGKGKSVIFGCVLSNGLRNPESALRARSCVTMTALWPSRISLQFSVVMLNLSRVAVQSERFQLRTHLRPVVRVRAGAGCKS